MIKHLSFNCFLVGWFIQPTYMNNYISFPNSLQALSYKSKKYSIYLAVYNICSKHFCIDIDSILEKD